ncbi:MAG: GNAT family N-acetyltransferase [Lewinellaceae bacterium]|nr:GNAT family N-acetyltransferase [Lewinellaceae bacterium]
MDIYLIPWEKKELRLRSLTTADLASLCAFAEQTFRVAWEEMNDPEAFEAYCKEHFTAKALQMEMEAPNVCFYFAEIDAEVVAYLKLNYNAKQDSLGDEQAVQLERIYVDTAWLGQGLGAALMGFCQAQAKLKGAQWLWLSVWKKAPRSIHFYEKLGFEIFGVETFWVGNDPQPDWLMKKRLGD